MHGQFFRRLARFPYFLLGALARYLMFVGLIYFVLVCFLPHGYTVGGGLGTLISNRLSRPPLSVRARSGSRVYQGIRRVPTFNFGRLD